MPLDIALKDVWLNRLLPLHLVVGRDDKIIQVGPTLKRLNPGADLIGDKLFDWFEVISSGMTANFTTLANTAGTRLRLRFRKGAQMVLKGHAVPNSAGDHLLINLSLGIAANDAVAEFGLTMGDFDPTDLTVELLYLMEAKSAVMQELRVLVPT